MTIRSDERSLLSEVLHRHDALDSLATAAAAAPLVGTVGAPAVAQETHSTAPRARGSSEESPDRSVTLNAQPAPIVIDAAKTALLVIDMQNDFGSKGGMFDRMGIDVSTIQRVVDPICRVVASVRSAGIRVVYLKMGFRPDLSDLGAPGSPNRERHLFFDVGKTIQTPDGQQSRILIRDAWGTDIVPPLRPEAEDVVMYKHRHSGFFETELDETLQRMGVRYLIVTGCTTSICVGSTVQDAMFRDYSCVVLSDCTAEPIAQELPRSNHQASLLAIHAVFGWVSNSDEVIRTLSSHAMAADQS